MVPDNSSNTVVHVAKDRVISTYCTLHTVTNRFSHTDIQ
jgi:hypothetical protein